MKNINDIFDDYETSGTVDENGNFLHNKTDGRLNWPSRATEVSDNYAVDNVPKLDSTPYVDSSIQSIKDAETVTELGKAIAYDLYKNGVPSITGSIKYSNSPKSRGEKINVYYTLPHKSLGRRAYSKPGENAQMTARRTLQEVCKPAKVTFQNNVFTATKDENF